MKIVYWARLALAKAQITAQLNAVDGVELTVADNLPDLLAALHGAEGLVLADAPPAEARQVVDALRAPGGTLRWMHFITAGREGFEAVGLPPGVAITYAAGGAAPAVAEHAMALLLALGRRVPDMLRQGAERRWDRALAARATSLEGQTMVIVGFGHIGQEIAKRARGFGVRIVALSRAGKPHALADQSRPLSELHAVLGEADSVMVAIALTEETRHLLDRAAFAACKHGALIVNVARGGVIDQTALREALASGQLGGAGVDVTDPEPLPSDDPLWGAPNLLVSPHFAGAGSPGTLDRLAGGAADNLRRLLAGEPLKDQVAG
jgi:phosphoglycerate dehydrogenase-like enzyme